MQTQWIAFCHKLSVVDKLILLDLEKSIFNLSFNEYIFCIHSNLDEMRVFFIYISPEIMIIMKHKNIIITIIIIIKPQYLPAYIMTTDLLLKKIYIYK